MPHPPSVTPCNANNISATPNRHEPTNPRTHHLAALSPYHPSVDCVAGYFSKTPGTACAACAIGYYTSTSGGVGCSECLRPRTTSGLGAVACDACRDDSFLATTFTAKAERKYTPCEGDEQTDREPCCECPQGALCIQEGGTSVETMLIRRDYYRYTERSTQVLECDTDHACRPHTNSTDYSEENRYCAEKYKGPLCASCTDGAFRDSFTSECMDCEEVSVFQKYLVALIAIVLILLYAMGYCILSTEAYQDWYEEYEETILGIQNYATMFFITWQIIVNLQEVHEAKGGASYPDLFRHITAALEKIVSLNFIEIIQFDCLVRGSNYSHKLFATTLLPLVVGALVLIYEIIKWAFCGGKLFRGILFKWAIVAIYFLLPVITIIISRSFDCTGFDDGEGHLDRYLAADMQLDCESNEYKFMRNYAQVMVVCFPFGVPFFLWFIMYTRRDEIMQRETREGGDELSSLSFLFGLYAPNFYWMSVMDLARRLALSSFLLFMTPAYQILVALTISITFTVACRELRVFYEGHLDLVYYICGWETVLSALALLFMDAQAKGDFKISQDLVSFVLITTNAGVVLLIVYSTDRIRHARSEETVAKVPPQSPPPHYHHFHRRRRHHHNHRCYDHHVFVHLTSNSCSRN